MAETTIRGGPAPTPGRRTTFLLSLAALILFSGFVALGTWQVQRRAWKHELIARVTQRVHAAPVAAPGPPRWADITAPSDEYRHVSVSGTLLGEHTVLAQAVTELGAGYWMLTPLRTTDGWLVLVNRGFVPTRAPAAMPATGAASEPITVTGLLRMSEPGGAFLRKNDPAAGRWYSRDVAAIAAAQHLLAVAPYFIDADAAPAGVQPRQIAGADGSVAPVGGLTVIAFSDNHLVYALTWYALALMVVGTVLWLRRTAAKARRRQHENVAVEDKVRDESNPENGIDRKTRHGRAG